MTSTTCYWPDLGIEDGSSTLERWVEGAGLSDVQAELVAEYVDVRRRMLEAEVNPIPVSVGAMIDELDDHINNRQTPGAELMASHIRNAEQFTAAIKLAFTWFVNTGGTDIRGEAAPEAWLAAKLHMTDREAATYAATAKSLSETARPVRQAQLDGDLIESQAGIIRHHLSQAAADIASRPDEDLPSLDFFAGLMLEEFSEQDAGRIGRKARARRTKHYPETIEELTATQIQNRYVKLWVNRNGDPKISGSLAPDLYEKMTGVLNAGREKLYRTQVGQYGIEDRTSGQLMHDALGVFVDQALADPDRPSAAGAAVTIQLTASVEYLQRYAASRGIMIDDLPDGDFTRSPEIAASLLEQMSCAAGISPVLTTADGQVLFYGRARRLFSGAQKLAIIARDGNTCAWPGGCKVPAIHAEVHHLTPWNKGGKTDITNGVILCDGHHHEIHTGPYTLTRRPDGYRLIRKPDTLGHPEVLAPPIPTQRNQASQRNPVARPKRPQTITIQSSKGSEPEPPDSADTGPPGTGPPDSG